MVHSLMEPTKYSENLKAYKNKSPLCYNSLYIKINKIEKFNQHHIWCNLTKGMVSTQILAKGFEVQQTRSGVLANLGAT